MNITWHHGCQKNVELASTFSSWWLSHQCIKILTQLFLHGLECPRIKLDYQAIISCLEFSLITPLFSFEHYTWCWLILLYSCNLWESFDLLFIPKNAKFILSIVQPHLRLTKHIHNQFFLHDSCRYESCSWEEYIKIFIPLLLCNHLVILRLFLICVKVKFLFQSAKWIWNI